MKMRVLSATELEIVTGSGANTATENTGANRNRGGALGNKSGGGNNNCPSYKNPEYKECMNGILGGMVAGSIGGPGSALAGAIGGGIGSCLNSNGGGNNSAGGKVGGQCTW